MTPSIESQVRKIIDDLTAALPDAKKVDGGVAAAGPRVRKAAQSAKTALADLRANVIFALKAD